MFDFFKPIVQPVGPQGRNAPGDVRTVQDALARAGHFDLSVTGGADGFPGQRLVDGIKSFQKQAGLKQDGLITPGGPTETALTSRTGPKTPPKVGSRSQPAPPQTPPKTAPLHRRNRPKNTGDDVVRELYKDATRWHFEDRAARNAPLPQSEAEAIQQGFVQYPGWQSAEHQNKTGKAEKKYGHPDGREVVFDGDTGVVITDPRYIGTYNYVTPPPFDLKDWDYGEADDLVIDGGAHWIIDYVPYWLLGNDRKK